MPAGHQHDSPGSDPTAGARPSAAGTFAPLHAIVPVRSLSGGKLRLGGALDAEEREELVLGMLRHTLAVLTSWAPCPLVHVVSPDRALLGAVGGAGVHPLPQEGEGLNEAISVARREAIALGAGGLLVLPADLPYLEAGALDRLLEAGDAALAAGNGGPVVVVAASDARGGTNALLLRPPAVIEPRFGTASLEAHLREAAAAEAAIQVVTDAALGFDLDTPDDLELVDPVRLAQLMALGRDALAVADG